MIIYMADKLKKTNRKKSNALGKGAKNTEVKKGRTAKIYTMNIERKRILKQRREKNITRCKRQKTGRGIFPYSFKS